MILQSQSDIAFEVFGLPVYLYGIILAFAVLVGVFTADFISKKTPKGFFINNSPVIILGGLIGARFYYCVLNLEYYLVHPLEIFDIRQGGLSIHGMLLAGILTVIYVTRKNRLNFFDVADVLACVLPFCQSIGRWGNFFNSEAFGLPTNQKWGLFIPLENRPFGFENYELFHPAFLYESIFDLIIFLLLLHLYKNNDMSGKVFWTYLILYALVRIIVEYIRLDSALNIFGIPVAILVSVLMMFAGVFGLYWLNRFSFKRR